MSRGLLNRKKNLILQAPTLENQNLYTILDITDQALKEALSRYCDNQPFITQTPLALLFLADCRRWLDRVAAESLGIGSWYIGDILEQEEKIRDALALDDYVFTAAFVEYGYPTQTQKNRSTIR